MTKTEILKSALTSREEEILTYQINIDNYERAISKINADYSDNESMLEFRDRLAGMLSENKTEQLKSIIIRDVIADQLTELEAS